MGSFYGTIPDKTWPLTDDSQQLLIDVQAAPKTAIVCRSCKRRTVEGEPLLTVYVNARQDWRRSYCGLCAEEWAKKTVQAFTEAATRMAEMVEEVGGSGFYVAKDFAGKKGRESVKKLAEKMVLKCDGCKTARGLSSVTAPPAATGTRSAPSAFRWP